MYIEIYTPRPTSHLMRLPVGDAEKWGATMSNVIVHGVAPPFTWSANAQIHPAVVQACLEASGDEPTREIPWEPPTDDEWRRAALAIAKQVSLHIAGYRDHKEFAGDGCRFAWDVFDTIHLSSTRRDH
jgi:hypothetical protein